jgi:predicted ATPase
MPYGPLVRAFNALIIRMLSERHEMLENWRERLLEALGPQMSVLAQLLPDLCLVTGPPEPIPAIPANEVLGRFSEALLRFVSVFSASERPLILFLDDLQWLDTATLNVITQLMQVAPPGFVFIGSYRNDATSLSPAFLAFLDQLCTPCISLCELLLEPLSLEETHALITSYLDEYQSSTRSLTQAIYEKTGGNPFFTQQLVSYLREEKILQRKAEGWSWDTQALHRHPHADSVVDLMISRMERLPYKGLAVLQMLALAGDGSSLEVMSDRLGLDKQTLR